MPNDDDEYTPPLSPKQQRLSGKPVLFGLPGAGEQPLHIANAETFIDTRKALDKAGPRMVALLEELAESEGVEPKERIDAAKFLVEKALPEKAAAAGPVDGLAMLAAAVIKRTENIG